MTSDATGFRALAAWLVASVVFASSAAQAQELRSEDIFFRPVLGDNAGDISGPLVALQIGYRSR